MSRIVFALIALVLAAACGKHAGPADGKPRVAVSIFPLYDVTRRIAGDRLDVILVLPPGKSEHAFDPTPKEIARLSGTKLAIAVGLDLDAWIENVMKTAGSHPKVLRVGDKVQTIRRRRRTIPRRIPRSARITTTTHSARPTRTCGWIPSG
jgi:zinc transport system substrate-binding protein